MLSLSPSIMIYIVGLALLIGGQVFLAPDALAHWASQILGCIIQAWFFLTKASSIEDKKFRLFTRALGYAFGLMVAVLIVYLSAVLVGVPT